MRIKENIAISEEGFLFDPTTGDSFTLNETAREVLTLVKQGRSIEVIKKTLLESYDVNDAVLDRFLLDFFAELRQYNLIEE